MKKSGPQYPGLPYVFILVALYFGTAFQMWFLKSRNSLFNEYDQNLKPLFYLFNMFLGFLSEI